MTTRHRESDTERRAGRRVLWSLAAFFGVVFAANGAFIYLALDSWTGVTREDAYEAGLAYKKTLAEARAGAALGWSAEIAFRSKQDRAGRLIVTLRDRAGAGVNDLMLTAEVARPTHDGFDQTVPLVAEGDGRYAADLELPLAGQWEVRIAAEGGPAPFRVAHRILAP